MSFSDALNKVKATAEAEKTRERDVPRAQTMTSSRSRQTEEQEVELRIPGYFDSGDEAVVPRVRRRVRVPSVCSMVSVRSGTCSSGCRLDDWGQGHPVRRISPHLDLRFGSSIYMDRVARSPCRCGSARILPYSSLEQ